MRIQKWFCEGNGWKIKSVDGDLSDISTWNPLAARLYIQLPEELRKRIINIKNKNDECVRWCFIRHLNPNNIVSQRIEKSKKKCCKSWL